MVNHSYNEKSKSLKSIQIKLHKNWKQPLILLQRILLEKLNINAHVYDVNNKDAINFFIYKKEILKIFQDFILEHNIPAMKRKWFKYTNHEFDYEQQKWILNEK